MTLGSLQPASAGWDESYFPNVELVTQDGERVRLWDDLIEGKIVVVAFVYTECPDVCGLSTARLAQVSDWLGDRVGRDIFLYSMSLDPQTDTPDKLKAYAEAFDAPDGWQFLTGDPEDMDLVRFKLGERSRKLSEHRSDMVIGNAATGEWRRASLMGSLVVATEEILRMDPSWSPQPAAPRDSVQSLPLTAMRDTPGEGLFLTACAACHSIGDGIRVGPDSAGVTLRREREWLEEYLLAPERMLARGDAVAVALDGEFPAVRMPNFSLNQNDVQDLLRYLQDQTDLIDLQSEVAEVEHDHHDHASKGSHGANDHQH